jgi:hypothetical protein
MTVDGMAALALAGLGAGSRRSVTAGFVVDTLGEGNVAVTFLAAHVDASRATRGDGPLLRRSLKISQVMCHHDVARLFFGRARRVRRRRKSGGRR